MANPTPDPHRDEPTPQPEEGLRPEADPSVIRPEQDEKNGPLPGLLATAAADVSEEVGLGDAEAEEQLDDAGVEAEGIASGQIVGVTVAILVSVFLMGFVVFWAFYLPELGESEDAAAAEVELAPEQRSILAEGNAALGNYGLSADSTYTLPIGVAMASVVEGYSGSAVEDALDGDVGRDEVPMALTRQGFNVAPIYLHPARAMRAASSRGALTAPVPETGDETPIPPSVAAEPRTDEEIGVDDFPADAEPVINQ